MEPIIYDCPWGCDWKMVVEYLRCEKVYVVTINDGPPKRFVSDKEGVKYTSSNEREHANICDFGL